MRPDKIVSGGQAGVDRGALDVAIAAGVPHGGWCPLGRRAEDGPIPDRYQLVEMPTAEYGARTLQNVLDTDGTLILRRDALSGGTLLTRRLARRHGKPCLVVTLDRPDALERIRAWLEEHKIAILNVAGPRESENPGIQSEAAELIGSLLAARH
jgi:hypothetical protein